MSDHGIEPDNYTYSTLFKGIKNESSSSDLNKAFVLYDSLAKSSSF
jgi:hypothetical protein